MLCYNLGVELYQRKMFEDTIAWLRESFELGKNKQAIGARNQVPKFTVFEFIENGMLILEKDRNNEINLKRKSNMKSAEKKLVFVNFD